MPIRHFLDVDDLTSPELINVLDRSDEIRSEYESQHVVGTNLLNRRMVALLTLKESLRTDASIAIAADHLGGTSKTFSGNSSLDELGHPREPIADMGRCLDQMGYAMIFARLGSHKHLLELAHATKKAHVINALTDSSHPLQALADMAAFRRVRSDVQWPHVAFLGDGNNVAFSLAQAVTKLGGHFRFGGPQKHAIHPDLWEQVQINAKVHGGSAIMTQDPEEAVDGAHFVYTDVHASMGQKSNAKERKAALSPYRVTSALMNRARQGAVFGHCLPAQVGEEVDEEVLYGPQSIVFEIAGARMDTTAALMELLMKSR